jgi:O-antigen/teichoic acid export membrane protein
MIVVQLAAQVADFGSRDALVRDLSRAPGRWAEAWRTGVASRVPLLAAGSALFWWLTGDPVRAGLLSAWLVALFLARVHEALVAYRRRFATGLVIDLGAAGATLGLLLVAGAGVTPDALLALFTVTAVARASAYALAFPCLRLGPGWALHLPVLRRAWPFFALTFSGALQSRVDLYVVAAVLPAAAVGQYQVLASCVLLAQSLAGALLNPVVPALYRATRAFVVAGVRRLLRIGILVATCGIAGVATLVSWLYQVPVSAGLLVGAWLAIAAAFAYLPLVYLAFREGGERVVVGANLVGIGVSGSLALLLAPVFGLAGAMAGAAAGQLAILGVHLWRTRRARPAEAGAQAMPSGVRIVEPRDALPDV